MALSQAEFERLLADPTKRIVGDIVRADDPHHPPARRFRVRVDSGEDWPITVRGWWNPYSKKLTYLLIHATAGRIVGLDLGYDEHTNRDGAVLQGTHKHRWSEESRDANAYSPLDITGEWHQPLDVWRQFCAETRILHRGAIAEPEAKEIGR